MSEQFTAILVLILSIIVTIALPTLYDASQSSLPTFKNPGAIKREKKFFITVTLAAALAVYLYTKHGLFHGAFMYAMMLVIAGSWLLWEDHEQPA